ncbi:MAG TPA: twin-arginine translocase subunit TatC [Anaerolineaceae bacterium]|nr:twin-arginine translocase subunit TatC [Anaerolineaceae bacterium]
MEDTSSEKMPLSQHLEDLRKVLFRALLGLLVGVIAGAFFVKPVLDFLARPIGGVGNLQVIEVTESMSVYMRVTLLIGLIVALPWIFFQLFSFVGKGLKKSEKRGLIIAIPFATILFLAGGTFAFFVMLPASMKFFTSLLAVDTSLRLSSYFGFVTNLIFWIAMSFELPLLVFVLTRVGVIKPDFLTKGWRVALVVIAVLAAVITPTGDPVNMVIFMLPLFVLYLMSIGLSMLAYKARRANESESPEVV